MRSLIWAACCFFIVASASAKDDQEYKADPLAVKFGTLPTLGGARLSPDGRKISLLQWTALDIPVAIVYDDKIGKSKLVLGSKKGEFNIEWCDWANNTRLLCGLRGLIRLFGVRGYFPTTRIVAVNADGSDMKVLLERKLRNEFAQYQDRIVDWLVDDPDNVLIQVPATHSSGVRKLNIYTGRTDTVFDDRDQVYNWLSDGRGNPRLYFYSTENVSKWYVRKTKDASWSVLHESMMTDLDDDFSPVGFGDDENELLYFDSHDGRRALWSRNLASDEEPHLVFAHNDVDVGHLLTLGKFRRLVAVAYATDRVRWHFFDKTIAEINKEIASLFPDVGVDILDESWDRNYYLVRVGGAQEPGVLYRLDRSKRQLLMLSATFPKLAGTPLAPIEPIIFKARDGVEIPGYLTRPVLHDNGPLPTIVFPHGGPQSRDVWGFDPIVQFLAASGYAVLQVNYRGSGGYGADWSGPGGFKNWRQAINDITDGAKSLIEDGTSDPSRMCVVGWSYGGYAALMSVIENPEMYKCVVSIAGVTDPQMLVRDYSGYLNHRAVQAFIGHGDEVTEQGSPQKRAAEIKVPVLLFQGEKDVNLSAEEGREMAEKLDHAHVSYQYIEYEDVEHDILRNQYRIDMLSRIGEFLKRNIGAGAPGSGTSSTSSN